MQQGLAFLGDDDETVALDGEARWEFDWTVASVTDVIRTNRQAFLACADSVAYRLDGYHHVLTEYKLGAEPRPVAIPEEVVESARNRIETSTESRFRYGYSNLFLAADGRLVVEMPAWGTSAAVVDPATGCYALLKNDTRPGGRQHVGMFADSVVTLESSREPMPTMMVEGKRHPVYSTDRSYIFVRPLRPTSGALRLIPGYS